METTTENTSEAAMPLISVIICTRDRGDTLLPAVQSILEDAPTDGSAELVIIDQGRDDVVEQALLPIQQKDQRLRYVRSDSAGLSAARNAGLRAARGAIAAFTDDDCTVEPGWMATLLSAFEAHPDAGLIFGYVLPGQHDPSKGILPDFKAVEGQVTRKRMMEGSGRWGMGANMAIRRSAWEKIGPFDELMGAGAPLISAEDIDYVLRAARHHIPVYHCERARVIHYGFRSWSVASKLMKGYSLGKGAMYAKHGRSGDLFAVLLLLSDLRELSWTVLRNGIRGQRPLGANALIYQVRGVWRGLWLPLDRQCASAGPLFRTKQRVYL